MVIPPMMRFLAMQINPQKAGRAIHRLRSPHIFIKEIRHYF
jgi:hypothetical protein